MRVCVCVSVLTKSKDVQSGQGRGAERTGWVVLINVKRVLNFAHGAILHAVTSLKNYGL